MAVVKVLELISESEKGWEEAAKLCVEEASHTIKNIKSVYVKEMQAVVENNKVTRYRVNCKVSFVVDDNMRQHP